MSKRPIDRTADILSRRLERAAVILPEIRAHIQEQRSHTRTIGAASLAPGRAVGTHADPTVHSVMQLDHCDTLEAHIDIQLGVIQAALDILDTHCRDALGYRRNDDPEPRPRCIGDNGPEGSGCWNIPAPRRDAAGTKIEDGRCITCGHRWDARKRAEADARRMRRHLSKLGET